MTELEHTAIHKLSSNHAEALKASKMSGCFFCERIFPIEEIEDWTDEGTTAICPYCGIDALIADSDVTITTELIREMNQRYFSYGDINDEGVEVYITTDLLMVDGAYCFNAVYAFKSMTSVKSYEKYLKSTGEDHKLIVMQVPVVDFERKLNVITVMGDNDDIPEYKSTSVFEDYDDAVDYKANIKNSQPSATVELDTVKIRSRFSLKMLHSGFADLF